MACHGWLTEINFYLNIFIRRNKHDRVGRSFHLLSEPFAYGEYECVIYYN